VDSGHQEVVLTGVNVGEYGADLESADVCESVDLLGLMEAVDDVPGLRRFRVSSVEVTHLSDAVIDFFAGSRRFCRHLHVPLQSGDDRVLDRMRRPYTRAEYLERLARLADRVPGIGIGGDVMVGFPGETDEAHRATVDAVRESPLAYLHVFPYSARKGTPAARMPEQVSPSIRKARAAELRDVGERKRRAFIDGFIGEALEVLFEGRREADSGYLQGVTDNYIRVFAPGPDGAMDRIRRVHLGRVDGDRVVGEIIEDASCG
jgi:threonylcarbamoyladenosine tRNA methylthiotransferase MtaB